MKSGETRWVVVVAAAAVTLLLPNLVAAQSESPPLEVPARRVPVPAAASPEFQRIVARDLLPVTDPPTTPEEWKQLQETRNSAAANVVQAVANQSGAKIEPDTIAGVSCFWVTPRTIAPGKVDHLIVHVHGGAFVFGGGLAGVLEALLLADACQARVVSVDYRMPPDHPFPAAPDDVFAVWKKVIEDHDPSRVVMGGTSAGGTLTMTTVQRCRAEGVPAPAAIFLGTPGADLTKTGDSMFLNTDVDNMIRRFEGQVEACLKLYAQGRDLRDPLLSPIYGDFSGFPPTILITGTRDMLLSATARTHRKLRAAGVVAEIHVYEGMSHAEYLLAYATPEGKDMLAEIAGFFERFIKPAGQEKGQEKEKEKESNGGA